MEETKTWMGSFWSFIRSIRLDEVVRGNTQRSGKTPHSLFSI